MQSSAHHVPPPDLRIIPTAHAYPHETHDDQRSLPLAERMRHAETIINPPIVAPVDPDRYVILDGANRCHVFRHLEYPHLLVQVVGYESGFVELKTWQHIISGWSHSALLEHLRALDDVSLHEGQDRDAVAHILFPDGNIIALLSPVQSTHERNAVLSELVEIYQNNATLYRTAIAEPAEIWPLYPEAIGLVVFPHYTPADIIAAVRYEAYLPPGISRHIIHGRALRVNYPLDDLQNVEISLADKNSALQSWVQARLASREVRYYAEATYQFGE